MKKKNIEMGNGLAQPTPAIGQNGPGHFGPFLFELTVIIPNLALHELQAKMGQTSQNIKNTIYIYIYIYIYISWAYSFYQVDYEEFLRY